MSQEPSQPVVVDNEIVAFNKRIEGIGWGLFLIMLGGFALVPNNWIPEGWWSIGVGLIMLGLNAARYYYKIKMSGFTTFLGIVLLGSGILELVGLNKFGGAIFLIALGLLIIVKPIFDRRGLFGKAEQS